MASRAEPDTWESTCRPVDLVPRLATRLPSHRPVLVVTAGATDVTAAVGTALVYQLRRRGYRASCPGITGVRRPRRQGGGLVLGRPARRAGGLRRQPPSAGAVQRRPCPRANAPDLPRRSGAAGSRAGDHAHRVTRSRSRAAAGGLRAATCARSVLAVSLNPVRRAPRGLARSDHLHPHPRRDRRPIEPDRPASVDRAWTSRPTHVIVPVTAGPPHRSRVSRSLLSGQTNPPRGASGQPPQPVNPCRPPPAIGPSRAGQSSRGSCRGGRGSRLGS